MGRLNISKIVLFLFLVTCISTSVIPIVLSLDLMQATSYESMVAILDKSYVTSSYFVRVIMRNLDYLNFSFANLYSSLITSLSLLNLLVIALTSYVWAANKEKWMSKHFRNVASHLVVFYAFGYGIIALLLVLGFQASDAGSVIALFSNVAIIMLLIHAIIIIYALYYLYLLFRYEFIPYLNHRFPKEAQ